MRGRRWRFLFSMIAVAIMSTMMVSGCAGNKAGQTNKVDKQASAPAEKIETQSEPEPVSIGETVKVGDWSFVVDRLVVSEKVDEKKPADGKEFLEVNFTIKNMSKAIAGTGPAYFKLTDKQGNIYTVTQTMDRIFNIGPIEAGKEVTSSMVFEVPKDKKNLVLTFEPFTEKGHKKAAILIR